MTSTFPPAPKLDREALPPFAGFMRARRLEVGLSINHVTSVMWDHYSSQIKLAELESARRGLSAYQADLLFTLYGLVPEQTSEARALWRAAYGDCLWSWPELVAIPPPVPVNRRLKPPKRGLPAVSASFHAPWSDEVVQVVNAQARLTRIPFGQVLWSMIRNYSGPVAEPAPPGEATWLLATVTPTDLAWLRRAAGRDRLTPSAWVAAAAHAVVRAKLQACDSGPPALRTATG